jgi:hypothetical protein
MTNFTYSPTIVWPNIEELICNEIVTIDGVLYHKTSVVDVDGRELSAKLIPADRLSAAC